MFYINLYIAYAEYFANFIKRPFIFNKILCDSVLLVIHESDENVNFHSSIATLLIKHQSHFVIVIVLWFEKTGKFL